MVQFIARRLLAAVPLLFIISVLIFFGLRFTGADPVAYLATDPRVSEADRFLIRARYGLNDPVWLQYVHWLIGDDWYRRDVTGDGVADEYGTRRGILRGGAFDHDRAIVVASVVGTERLTRSTTRVDVVVAVAIVEQAFRAASWGLG